MTDTNTSASKIAKFKQIIFELEYESFNRASRAIHCVKHPITIDTENLNKDSLVALAEKTHHSCIHFSGNCILLSLVFLFNLKAKRQLLTVGNIYPFFKGLSYIPLIKLLFNQQTFSTEQNVHGIKACEKQILESYTHTGEKFYIILREDHALNAVIINNNGTPKVQFVDTWKTSNYVPSYEDLEKKYPDDLFTIATVNADLNFQSIINTLKNPLKFNSHIDLINFKKAYVCHFQQSFFKNPWSKMKQSLDMVKTMDFVFNYAKNNPNSRTAEVIKNLNLGFSPNC